MLPKGTFVVWGTEFAPRVVTLGADEFEAYMQAAALRWRWRDQAGAYHIFGAGCDHAVPAWSLEAMTLLGEGYEGCHRENVRALCAAVALGMSFEELRTRRAQTPAKAERRAGNDAGRVPSPQPAPVAPSPAGATFS